MGERAHASSVSFPPPLFSNQRFSLRINLSLFSLLHKTRREGLDVAKYQSSISESPFMTNHIYSIYKKFHFFYLCEDTDSVDPKLTLHFFLFSFFFSIHSPSSRQKGKKEQMVKMRMREGDGIKK